jgi:steroid delta-isomerase-like uncharacterized protein
MVMSGASLDVARVLVDAYNSADWSQLEAVLEPDSVYDEVGSSRRAEGVQAITELFKGWKRAMPDSHGTVTGSFDVGDTAVLEVTWTGTFTGPWATPDGDVEPTGKHQTTRACIVSEIEADKIKQSRQYFDSMSLMQQLGLTAAPAAA